MTTTNLLKLLRLKQVEFKDVLTHIDDLYLYSPSSFKNGLQNNSENENQGSARVLFYAKINNLSKEEALELFAEHYTAVLSNPAGTDHQNIRQFQSSGWDSVHFDNDVLTKK